MVFKSIYLFMHLYFAAFFVLSFCQSTHVHLTIGSYSLCNFCSFLFPLLSLKSSSIHFCHLLRMQATFNDIWRFQARLFLPHVNRFWHKSKNVAFAFQYHFLIQNYGRCGSNETLDKSSFRLFSTFCTLMCWGFWPVILFV